MIYHEELESWNAAMNLVEAVYRSTGGFPVAERYGLAAQARRAAVSIPANIAEGAARGGRVEYVRFLRIARASLAELETLVVIAFRLELIETVAATRLTDSLRRVAKLLNGQIRALQPQ